MSKVSRDTVDEILASAGAEHSARHGEVIDHPLRSKFLARTAPKPLDGTEVPTPVAWLLLAGPYLAVLAVAAVAFLIYVGERRQMILADIGRTTCSADSSLMLEYDPGSDVPKISDAVLIQCAKAHELF